ncbi:hypothetical protein [Candidatus Deferrimicrobium sp.]
MGLRDYESVRERAAMARAIGPMAICERNMTLPARRRPAVKR